MKKYIAFNIVNKVKFYRTNKNEWSSTKENLKIFLEYETEDFFNKRKRKYEKRTIYSQILVEEFSNESD